MLGAMLVWGQLCTPDGGGWAALGSAKAGPHACGCTGPYPALPPCREVAQQDQLVPCWCRDGGGSGSCAGAEGCAGLCGSTMPGWEEGG